ncbi:MAG: small, acid-soluble spore protein L [Bacillaceae bacterium]|nr:small, acid-soluble spore protein L [Bacillaceae bacterium]
MTKNENHRNRGKRASSVNPQGLSEDEADQQPKSQLEQRAKKRHTRG